MKTFLIFHYVGYQSIEPNTNKLSDRVVLRLIGDDAGEVLTRAKKIVERQFWFLSEVVEYEKK